MKTSINIINNEKTFKDLKQGDIFYLKNTPEFPRIKLNPCNSNDDGNCVGLLDGICYDVADDTNVYLYYEFEFNAYI